MKNNKLQEQQYLENRILNPTDRSQGRYDAILEYVKKNGKIEWWITEGTTEKFWSLNLNFPDKKSINYHIHLKENTPKELEKAQEYLTKKIFDNHYV